jgi:Fic family protein
MSGVAERYPWLDFAPERQLRADDPRLWMHLGEAKSKCEHLASTPLEPAVADQFHRVFLARGVQATTAIEGNTLELAEVEAAVEGTLRLPPSRLYLQREVQNVISLCNRFGKVAEATAITPALLCEINAGILAELAVDEHVQPDQVRRSADVTVGRYRPPRGADCPELVERYCAWLRRTRAELPDAERMEQSILAAILAHLYFAWIHPFGDGNGRGARMVEFLVLLDGGIPTPAAHLLSNHYNATRTEYYRQLDRAREPGGVHGFVAYALRGFVDQLRGQLAELRAHQRRLAWTAHVDRQFPGRAPADRRRRDLLIDLAAHGQSTPVQALHFLTERVRQAYGRRSYRTLERDVAALLAAGLLVEGADGNVRAAVERIDAFLPKRG